MRDLFLGLDIGTSGARAIVIDAAGAVRAEGKSAMADHGANHRSPAIWWAAASAAVKRALAGVDAGAVRALAVDGTSGTVLAVDGTGAPPGDALMYNDICPDPAIIARIDAVAPPDSAARGASSALARVRWFSDRNPADIRHQADWVSTRFSGRAVSDENNALKTGYDLAARAWPDWIEQVGVDRARLPDVVAPGTAIGPVTHSAAREFGFADDALVVAGTTDGCASFVATGADRPGDGVTVLGTTLTIKLLSDKQISAPEYGIYSHRILGHWLAGGASNTGGNVLLKFFQAKDLSDLSARIDPETDCDLDYYPLARPGERFPVADPTLPARLEPRPDDDAAFLKGLFDGIARIEALAYDRLHQLGAPPLASVRSVGGGAGNPVWTRMRERRLNVPMPGPASTEAAYGTALLARRGAP
ncbi:MAG: FGGY-family carbohydrate kinase [Rhodobacter sp.]|nr:FGGY-family carbohydrate kinase [Rhodobacter sp.]